MALFFHIKERRANMNREQYLKNLSIPKGPVDVVLDTDAFNEIDDQFAIAYLLRSEDKLDTKAIYAAPFLNSKVSSAAEGMEKNMSASTGFRNHIAGSGAWCRSQCNCNNEQL